MIETVYIVGRVKIQTLKALMLVEEVGSIRAAAKRLHLTQPTLTTAIQQLEDEMCAPLLVRTKQGVTFTDFGRTFLRRAKVIVHESERAQQELAQLRGHWEGRIRFSASPAIALSIVPQALREFLRSHPGVEVHCADGVYPAIASQLRDGALDFALSPASRFEVEPDIAAEPIFSAEVVVVARRRHPQAKATSVAALQDCAWVFATTSPGPGAVIEQVFADAGLRAPRRALLCESILALPGVVLETGLLTTMPRVLFEHCAHRGALCVVPVAEKIDPIPICLLRRHDLPLTPAANELVRWFQHFARKQMALAHNPGPATRPLSRSQSKG